MYADAGPFVISLAGDERLPLVAACRRFVASIVHGGRTVATSTLTWDEVAFVTRRLLGPEDSAEKAEEFLRMGNVRWIAVDETVVRGAANLYRTLPIRPRDAIHAACVLVAGETEIVSEDRVFDRVPGVARVWPPP